MSHNNNFDFLRLLFASTVIFSHSYPLTGQKEFFEQISNSQINLGALSVNIFFILSGFLIFNSLKYSNTIYNYLWKRILRLFPALVVMLFSTALILILVSNGKVISQTDFYTYIPNNLSLFNLQNIVENVFEKNPYPKIINGSLWSLCYEFTMYIFVCIFFPFRKNQRLSAVLLVVTIALLMAAKISKPVFLMKILQSINLESKELLRLAPYFLMGSLLTFIKLDRYNNWKMKVFLAVILVVSLFLNAYSYVSYFVLPMLVILIGLSFNKTLAAIPKKTGDISYGIYIYGFMIQQTLMNYFNLNMPLLFLISFLITLLPAYLSYHCIEKPAMKFKNLI